MEQHEYIPLKEATPLQYHGLGTVLKSISLMVIICVGAIGNALVVYAVVRDRRLHKAPYYFVINLTIADLLRSVICLPFIQSTVIHGSQWQYGSTSCKLLAFASTFFIFGAAFALLVLSVDRYLSVIHHQFHAKKLRGLMCLSIVLIAWGVAFVLAFPPVFGLGTYDFNPLEEECTFDHQPHPNNDTLGFVSIFMATSSVTLFIYGRIFFFLRKHRRMKPILWSPPNSQIWNFWRTAPRAPQPNNIVGMAIPMAQAATQGTQVQTGFVIAGIQQHHTQGNYIPMQQVTAQPIGIPQVTIPPQALNSNLGCSSSLSLRPVTKEHLTRAVFIVTLTYDLMWMPYIIATCLSIFEMWTTKLYDFLTVSTWLTYCQVALLPLVYILSHQPVRHHVMGTPQNVQNEEEFELSTEQSNVDI